MILLIENMDYKQLNAERNKIRQFMFSECGSRMNIVQKVFWENRLLAVNERQTQIESSLPRWTGSNKYSEPYNPSC